MERKRRKASAVGLVSVIVAVGVLNGCAIDSTDSAPVPVSTSAWPSTTTPVSDPSTDEEPPVMVLLPQSDGPLTDPRDPVAVAKAFVSVMTNRRDDEGLDDWRARLSRWATGDVSSAVDGRTWRNVLGVGIGDRNGQRVGSIVGSAVQSCDDHRCHVLIVADQTLLLDGKLLDERNFVTWHLTLSNSEGVWLVSTVNFGAGA